MGFTKQDLLDLLRSLQIDFEKYEHPVVLTVEAQAKYVGDKKGALSKNLFLKDKKNRFYIVSALAETKVDLKVLSQRLGLGKGGLRMAPEEALAEILQVPLGCVTPFALKNESASHVSLFLDQGFRTHDRCFFHPLHNDMTIAFSTSDLDKFLSSIKKTPVYIDLEANPTVGKDQPPDLAAYVPSDAKILDVPPEIKASAEKNKVSVNGSTRVVTAKNVEKSSKASVKESDPKPEISFADTDKFVEEILAKTSSLVLYKLKEEDTVESYREQLAINIKQLGLDLKNTATMFKNTAYTEGFSSGVHSQAKRI